MIALSIKDDEVPERFRNWAVEDVHCGELFYYGRIQSLRFNTSDVDRWFPMSSRLSRITVGLEDQDGDILRSLLLPTNDNNKLVLIGKDVAVKWIDGGETTLGTGIVRGWKAGPGQVSVVVEDPMLIKFGVPIGPTLGDIWDDVDEKMSGNVVPQVYGRATRLPVAGGRVHNNELQVMIALGHNKNITDVRYDGDLLDRPAGGWTATEGIAARRENPDLYQFSYLTFSSDTDRDPEKFEWSGGDSTNWDWAGAVTDFFRNNGLKDHVVREGAQPSFVTVRNLMQRLGWLVEGAHEGAIVVAGDKETVASVVQRMQNSWGVLFYADKNEDIQAALPFYDSTPDNVEPIEPDAVFLSKWGFSSAEGATRWPVESDTYWGGGSGKLIRRVYWSNEQNKDRYGRVLDGRVVKQHYARGRSAQEVAKDRAILENWNWVKLSVVVDPGNESSVGDVVRLSETPTLCLPEEYYKPYYLVDGISYGGSAHKVSKQLSLTRMAGSLDETSPIGN